MEYYKLGKIYKGKGKKENIIGNDYEERKNENFNGNDYTQSKQENINGNDYEQENINRNDYDHKKHKRKKSKKRRRKNKKENEEYAIYKIGKEIKEALDFALKHNSDTYDLDPTIDDIKDSYELDALDDTKHPQDLLAPSFYGFPDS